MDFMMASGRMTAIAAIPVPDYDETGQKWDMGYYTVWVRSTPTDNFVNASVLR